MVEDPAQCGISLARQAQLLGIARSTLYYQPLVDPGKERQVKQVLDAVDEIYTAYPFMGSRQIRDQLRNTYGLPVGRERVRSAMKTLGLQALYPRPRTSTGCPGHRVYPYLLKGVSPCRPNHVWGSDITYIRTQHGFVYLVAFLDWYSRYIVSWELSETMQTDFCVTALQAALDISVPEISNTDQGSQFTDQKFIQHLDNAHVRISMDGKGRYLDNIFTERLWRTVKYEDVYLKHYTNYHEAKEGLAHYITFYNNTRTHQALGHQTPASIYHARP